MSQHSIGERIIRHVIIRGRVQGVGYRAWTEDEALARGLVGWVRNRRDGSVEAVFAGRLDAVSDMIAACRRGPSFANVEAIDVRDAKPSSLEESRTPGSFSLLPTV